MKVPKNTQKAFAVSSVIGAILKNSNNGEPALTQLLIQIDRAIRVFSIKAGRVMYWGISHEVNRIWFDLAGKHETSVTDDEITKMIEFCCMMIPPKDFKDFLGVKPYVSKTKLSDEKLRKIANSVLEYDFELNKFLGTKPYGLIKPKQTKKEKRQTKLRVFLANRKNSKKENTCTTKLF